MKSFRNLVAAILLFASGISPSQAFWHGAPVNNSNNGGMLLGLGALSFFTNGPPFLNWALSGGSPSIKLVAGGTQAIATTITNGQMSPTTGELIAGAGLSTISALTKGVFTPSPYAPIVPPLNGASPWWNGLAMTITWTGTSTVSQDGSLGTGSTALSCGTNSCTFTFGLNPVNVGFDFAITNTADPPKNIFIYETKFASQVAALATCGSVCNHFSPDWLNVVKSFGILRTQDWMNVNNSSETDISQLADFNYQLCVACQFGGAAEGNATIAGTTMTVTATSVGSVWGIGEAVAGVGVTANSNIIGSAVSNSGACSPACTGNGLNGTYALSQSSTVSSEVMTGTAIPGSYFGVNGGKGGVHPSVAVELARLTGADIHYNIPVTMSDAGMTAIANYFNANMPAGQKVRYEYCNENWNFGLGICAFYLNGTATITGIGGGNLGYSGYRMSQLMADVQATVGTNSYNAFSNTASNWMGVIGGQMTTTTTTPSGVVAGFGIWQATFSPTTNLKDLYGEVVIAPYFSDFPNTNNITAVTPGTTTTITAANSFSAGQVKRLYFGNVGAGTVGSVLNNQDVTLLSANSTSFTFSNINTTGKTYTSAGASDYAASGPLEDMVDASTACFGASTATATGTLSGNNLTLSGISGTIVVGEGVSGSGIPTNTYLDAGSGTSWTTNNSATVGPVAVTFAPCATKYQFFAQQWSKALITGTNDYNYAPSIPINGFPTIFANNALYANSQGLVLSEYEGGNQFVVGGQYGPPNPLQEFSVNWQWDAAGNDPLYTPALVYADQFQMLRDVHSAYSAKYVEQFDGGPFGGVRYLGDSNPSWSAIVAENARGPYVDPISPVFGGTATYAGDATNYKFANSSGGTSITDTLTTAVIGTAAIDVFVLCNNTGSTSVTGVTVDGVAATEVVGSTGNATIWHAAVGSGTNVRTVAVTTNNGTSQFRSFYVVTVSGLSSATPISSSTAAAKNTTLAVTRGQLILTTGRIIGSPGTYAATSGVSQSVVQTLFSDINNTNVSVMAGFVSPFSSNSFIVDQGLSGSIAVGTFR